MDIVNTQVNHVVHTGGDVGAGNGGAQLGEGQVLTLVHHAGGLVDGEVTDVQLPDDGVGVVALGHVGIVGPALGVGGIQIHDHAPVAVDTGGTGIGVNCFHSLALAGDGVGVVDAVQVAFHGDNPGAVHILGHLILTQLFTVVAGGVEVHQNLGSGGSPDTEGGGLCSPVGAQVVACVGELSLKVLGGVGVGNGHNTGDLVEVQGVDAHLVDDAFVGQAVGLVIQLLDGGNDHLALGTFQGEGIHSGFLSQGVGNGDLDGAGLVVIDSSGDLGAQGSLGLIGDEVLQSGAGDGVDVHNAAGDIGDVDVAVTVGVLGPGGSLDDEANPHIGGIGVVGSDLPLLAFVLHHLVSELTGRAQGLHAVPHMHFPVGVVAVGTVVVDIDGDVILLGLGGAHGIGSGCLGQDVADLQGLGVEGDGHIVGIFGGEGVVGTVGAAHAPVVIPGAGSDLALMGAGGNALEQLLVQAVSVQGHFVGGVAGVPAHTAQTVGAGNIVVGHVNQGHNDLLGLGVEGDQNVLNLLGDKLEVVSAAVLAPGVGPGAVGDLELMGTGGDVLIVLLVQAGLGVQGHLVGIVAGVPAGAAEVLGAGHHILGLHHGLFGDFAADNHLDILGVGIEGDGDILHLGGFEGVVVAAHAPAVVPGTVGNLELMLAGGNIREGLFIQTVSIQFHLVVGICVVPLAAAQGAGACHIVGAFSSEDAHGNAAQQHCEHKQKTNVLLHESSSKFQHIFSA